MTRTIVIAFLTGLALSTGPAAAQQPGADDIAIEVHIIGLEVNASAQAQLQAMAQAAGGTYHASDDPASLTSALAAATGIAVAGSALQTVESEPNDSFGQANPIAPSGPISGRIVKKGDADWYEITVPHQGELIAATTEVPAELDVVFRVWNANKDVIGGWYGPSRAGGETRGVIDLPEAGLYRLEVRDGNNDAFSDSDYALNLDFTATPDTAEPNNQFGEAQPIQVDTPVSAAILPRGDGDWYAVTVDHQGALDVTIADVPKELDITYRVWNADKDVVGGWYRPLAAGADLAGVTDLSRPGTYYIEVRDGNNDARSAEGYKLTTAFRPTPDTAEPNDRFGDAQLVQIDTPAKAAILPRGDSDWYAIDLPHQGALTVSVTKPPKELDMVYRVWSANKDPLTGWFAPLSKGGDTVHVVDIPAPGRWTVEVRDGNNDARSADPYTFALGFEPTADAAEPNNRFGDATPIQVGSEIDANILPKGDGDWYVFDIVEQGSLTVEVTEVDDALDIVFRAWNANKDTITGWYAPLRAGGPTSGVIDFDRPGSYTIEVRDGNNDARSIKPYHLKTSFEPTGDKTEPSTGRDSAAALTLGQPMQASIFPKRDHDWFSVNANRDGVLRVAISSVPPELDLHFRVWDEAGHVISGWHAPLRAGGDVEAEVGLPSAGRYVIEVVDGNDDASATAPYTIVADISAKPN